MNNISAKDLLDILLKNLIIIILAAVICATGAYVYCEKFTDEKFASHGSILVTNGGIITDNQGKPVENSQIAASINLLPTIQKLLASPDIYKTVAEQFNNKYDNFDIDDTGRNWFSCHKRNLHKKIQVEKVIYAHQSCSGNEFCVIGCWNSTPKAY